MFRAIAHERKYLVDYKYQYFDLAPRLSGQKSKFFSFICLSIPLRDCYKGTNTKNKVCPESVGPMLGLDLLSLPLTSHLLPARARSRLLAQSESPIALCKATTKISNEFYQRGLIIINFLRIFGTRSIKT